MSENKGNTKSIDECNKMLEKIRPVEDKLCEYLNIPHIPLTVEEIDADSRFYFKPYHIVIAPVSFKNETEALKSLVHEYRHYFQYLAATSNNYKVDKELLNLWKEDFIRMSDPRPLTKDEYALQVIELDACAFTRFFLQKFYNLDIKHKEYNYELVIEMYLGKYGNSF